ncbi:MAG: hypothetical protein LBV47_03935 [Bacteroidales bacterium]|jgi:hypothetical protein|nr:hypothetical protein [Bacteroidales bacterium]
MRVSQVRESTNVRTFVKNTAFAGMKQTKYTQIPPAGMFKATVGRTVKYETVHNGQWIINNLEDYPSGDLGVGTTKLKY